MPQNILETVLSNTIAVTLTSLIENFLLSMVLLNVTVFSTTIEEKNILFKEAKRDLAKAPSPEIQSRTLSEGKT